MRIINFLFSAAGTQTWTPPTDIIIQGLISLTAVGGVLLTVNPSRTIADVITAASNSVNTDVLAYRTGANSSASMLAGGPLGLPVTGGTTLYIVAGAQTGAQILYQ